MLHYIIQTIAFQLFFLIIYDVFLKKETFFNWNRAYLLLTALLSLIIPFIKVSGFKDLISKDYIINLPEIFIGNTNQEETNLINLAGVIIENKSFWSWELVFYLGVGLATLLFTFKLVKLQTILYKNPKRKEGNMFIVSLLKSDMAFSFFNYIFLGEELKNAEREAVLKHEMVHVKQKHTLDLLFFELLRIVFWFNPLIYIFQNKIMSLHEYIADAQAVKNQNKKEYYQNLLSQVFETKNISFINPFFKQSLIKKRIIMLQKTKSKEVSLFKYALLIPLVLGMLIYTSCEKESETKALDLNQYSFTMKMGQRLMLQGLVFEEQMIEEYAMNMQEGQMSEENKAIHDKHIAILKENPEYAQWVIFDNETKTVSYSVHSEDEKLPKELDSKLGKVFFRERKPNSNKMYLLSKRLAESEQSEGQNEKVEYAIDVPFSVIEKVPVFPGCEGMSNKEQRDCMAKNISEHVNKKFNTKIADELNLKGRQRISVIFKIDINGDVVGVRSRAANKALEDEAIRVIKTLPKFKPGMQKGKPVNVPYSLPIIFQVAE